MAQKEGISATVTGNDEQVGFRAIVMKQAIEYNLAGSTKNQPNDIALFTLQGDPDRLNEAVAAIREGTKKSSDIEWKTTPAAVDPGLEHVHDHRLDVGQPKHRHPLHARLQAEVRRQGDFQGRNKSRLA